MSTKNYIKMFMKITNELSSTRQLVDDTAMIFIFLRGLGTQYIPYIVSINLNINHLFFEDNIASLKSHDTICALPPKSKHQLNFSSY